MQVPVHENQVIQTIAMEVNRALLPVIAPGTAKSAAPIVVTSVIQQLQGRRT